MVWVGVCSGHCLSSTPHLHPELGASASEGSQGCGRGHGERWPWPDVSCALALQVLTCPNASFTDLAEIVSRIEPPQVAVVDGELNAQDVCPYSLGWWCQCSLLTFHTLNKPPWAWLAVLWGHAARGRGLTWPSLFPDESDYLSECEEGLPDGPQDAYADFQSSPAGLGSDSVSCLDWPCCPLQPRVGLSSPCLYCWFPGG